MIVPGKLNFQNDSPAINNCTMNCGIIFPNAIANQITAFLVKASSPADSGREIITLPS
jgi:hypothetical protein